MPKSLHQINLLPGQEDTTVLQFLDWILNIGRLLIIIVYSLAIGTFAYRFSLDRRIQDLKDKVKNERLMVMNFQNEEGKFRNLQARLTLIKKLDSISKTNPTILSDIVEMGKGYITFNNISVSTDSISIEVKAQTVPPLTTFVNYIKKYPPVQSVVIDKVDNKQSKNEIVVGIRVNLKEGVHPDVPEADTPGKIVPFAN